MPSAAELQAAAADLATRQARAAQAAADYATATRQLEALREAAALAAEQYNGTKVRLDTSTRTFRQADARARAAETTLAAAQVNLGRIASQTYEAGSQSLAGLEAFLTPGGPGSALDQQAGLATLGQLQSDAVRKATTDAGVARELRRAARRANDQRVEDERAAAAARDRAADAVRQAELAAVALRAAQDAALLELARANQTTVALERRRQDAVIARAERDVAVQRQLAAYAGAGGGTGRASLTVAAPDPRAQQAIDFAMAQLGKWYLWGGSGPDRWDCSGLTQAAWGRVGVRIDHYTGSQWNQTDHLPLDQLQPGDLVFFGTSVSSIHHVGMYLGNGMMINAPHTGARVRIESMYWKDLLPYGGRVRG
ncbi:C40 family peptidase [Arsenicicoccus dermatophilus]|uniref:C40 family peptidase n=1 Tax=Arsenicicoccus dermatophilus TaxID=1076331 RepID=UPI001F4D320A|nr:C40 family peptidase [Arsenicicoccus dermatophilus]MCH8613917.1 C40 family peptidase [Arsenicicoccus dermatophilus]